MSRGLVLITGGYERLGGEFARAFKEDGWSVLLAGRDREKLGAAAMEAEAEQSLVNVQAARTGRRGCTMTRTHLAVLRSARASNSRAPTWRLAFSCFESSTIGSCSG